MGAVICSEDGSGVVLTNSSNFKPENLAWKQCNS